MEDTHLRVGTPQFRRTNLALFAAGFVTFALLYCVQPLMPAFSAEFQVTPAGASLVLSLSTALLSVALVVAGALSDALGRKGIMAASIVASTVLTLVSALVPQWQALLVVRAIEGVALAGVPAVAMAYVGEEMEPRSMSYGMGVYVGGTALGGMSGRLAAGAVADFLGWRWAVAATGLLAAVAAGVFWWGLPKSRHFHARPLNLAATGSSMARMFRDRGLRMLFGLGFLLMGGFVTLFNYVGYRLSEPPFGLSQSLVASIFVIYLLGSVASTRFGAWAGRAGRAKVLPVAILVMSAGLLLTLPDVLALVVLGAAVFTIGFFGAHTVVSSWVGARAPQARGQAASLYLFFYYVGSSVVGTLGGVFWRGVGWWGVAACVGLLLAVALSFSAKLARLES